MIFTVGALAGFKFEKPRNSSLEDLMDKKSESQKKEANARSDKSILQVLYKKFQRTESYMKIV